MIAKTVAASYGIEESTTSTQFDLLKQLRNVGVDEDLLRLFHGLRKAGNDATHAFVADNKIATECLVAAWQIAVWFYRTFAKGQENFVPKAFNPIYLTQYHKPTLSQAEQKAEEDKSRQAQEAEIARLRAELAAKSEQEQQAYRAQLEKRMANSRKMRDLDEKQTRLLLIDAQLREAGWEVDSENLNYQKGTRPEKGRNLAIAEYPCGKDRADYVLFCGLMPVGVVEAKKANLNVAGKIGQAERYSRELSVQAMDSAWHFAKRTVAWADANDGHYTVPFVYSCNGKPYVKQMAEKCGTWFRDVRLNSNTSRPLAQFHSPEGLLELLRKDPERAEQKLEKEPLEYLGLRYYQQNAIRAVEAALSIGKREILLAMATGTGKTRTIAGLIYRLLKADRFHRILFLVDRTSLATQANDTFDEMKMEQNSPLTQCYNFAENGEVFPETKVKVATVQAMVKQIFHSDNPPPIDQFDCIIIDEAHRGYTLDQEMTEGEYSVRDSQLYQSTYRRVLDYFDAVKIGLTATPAAHTTEIFGLPVFTYSYREAVIDDYLVDHEPPISYETALSQNGIHFEQGEKVESIDLDTGEVLSAELADEMDFDVASFNRRVINENFNRVICQELVKTLDPFSDEKTLIFCVTDMHADMVKRLLDEEFSQLYGTEYKEKLVAKITGQSDDPATLIKLYKNEHLPNIAITVDLLTTGIDVPSICNLVFLRRVKSRVLYEQMKGRATRRCDEIGKTVFRIYDAVGLYQSLQAVDTMKPLVKDVTIPLDQLAAELQLGANEVEDKHKEDVLVQFSQRVMRVLRKVQSQAEKQPLVKDKLKEYQTEWGQNASQLHQHFQEIGVAGTVAFLQKHPDFLPQLESLRQEIGTDYSPIISHHVDEIRETKVIYDVQGSADDYLERFVAFITEQRNENVALQALINRPRDLTRQQLKEIELLLSEKGFNKMKLNRAFKEKSNQEIAAGILAHIRRAALGDVLIPFEERVKHAMEKLHAQHDWTPVQKKWLDRLANQLVKNQDEIIDRERVNERFKNDGGAARFDAMIGNKLEQVIQEINESLWENVG